MLTERDLAYRAQRRLDFATSKTVTTGSAYASGNILGGIITIDNSAGVQGPSVDPSLSNILQSLVVLDPDAQNKAMDLFFFSQNPTSSGMGDKTAFTPTLAELRNCLGVVHIAAADYISGGTNGSIAGASAQANLGRVLKPSGSVGQTPSTAIYCVAVTRDTPTFSNGNLYFRFQFSNGL